METFLLERRYNIYTKLPFSSQGCLCVKSECLKTDGQREQSKILVEFFFHETHVSFNDAVSIYVD